MDFLEAIQKCEFGDRFRRALLFSAAGLVLFHLSCLVAPFIGVSSKVSSYLLNVSNAVSNLTVALVLMFLLVEGQKNLYQSAARRRQRSYAAIADQIRSWFAGTGSSLFEPAVVQPEASAFTEALQNFKVAGSPAAVLKCWPQFVGQHEQVAAYCSQIHFELTNYPGEMIYGVHFEFDCAELNRRLCQSLRERLRLDVQSREFAIDQSVPKRPEWIFLTRTVALPSGNEAGFATNLTHARHFVELVGHAYETVYGEAMIASFLAWEGDRNQEAMSPGATAKSPLPFASDSAS